jgi:hypothetical protein
MKVYLSLLNSDIDCFWNLYSEPIEEQNDYMFYEELCIENYTDIINLINRMDNLFDDYNVENNAEKFFNKFVKIGNN